MEKIIVNKKTRTVIYDTEKKIYKKYIRPKFKEKLKIFFGLKRSHGKNAAFLSEFLRKNGVKAYEVISYTKYSYITKEIEGKTLLESILEAKKDKKLLEEYIEKYIDIVKKIVNLNVYYGDFYFNNLMIDKNKEIYIIDIDEMEFTLYSKIFKNKKVIPRLNQTLHIQFDSLKGCEVEMDITAEEVFNKIIER